MTDTTHTSIRRRLLIGTLTIGMTIGAVTHAPAQAFISPMIGADFGATPVVRR